MNKKMYYLPEDVRNAILKYLFGKPYGEVAMGIQALQTLEEVKPAIDEEEHLDLDRQEEG